jgi:hypothetical protein
MRTSTAISGAIPPTFNSAPFSIFSFGGVSRTHFVCLTEYVVDPQGALLSYLIASMEIPTVLLVAPGGYVS